MANYAGVIRPFRPEDFERVADIYNMSHTAEYAGEVIDFSPEYLLDSPVVLDLFRTSEIYVFDDGAVRGFVGHKKERIIWLYIDPKYQGQKIGIRLIEFVMDKLNNIAVIVVVKSNQPALNLYRNLGFSVVNEFEFNYQDQPVKALNLISKHGLKLIEELES